MSDYIPYGRQKISDDDVDAVVEALRSDYLTTGPKVKEFERAFAEKVGAENAVAVSSGTAALHAAVYALGIGPGDEVIVPAMTFAATANAVVYQGGTPVFCDVDPETLLIDPADMVRKLTPRTKAVVSVDYAGQPCNYDIIENIVDQEDIALISDSCHSLGAVYFERNVGMLADLSTFSFHAVKNMTTGEGGMIASQDKTLARKMRAFRNHGIGVDHRARSKRGTFFYEMTDLGFNYRITDIQCALGLSQLKKLDGFIRRRQTIASRYDAALAGISNAKPLAVLPDRTHARHLYVIRIEKGRNEVFSKMRAAGIGVNVHYIPVHLHPYYQSKYKTSPGLCPVTEKAYDEILSLPIHPSMTDSDIGRVCRVLADACREARK